MAASGRGNFKIMRRFALFAAVGLTALAAAGAASAQTSIAVGRTVQGTLAASDRSYSDGAKYDCYVFRAAAGNYTVDLRSEAFDAYLGVGRGRDCTGTTTMENDDWDGLDSHIEFASDGGDWFILAKALDEGETGAYSLSLAAGGDPENMNWDGDDSMDDVEDAEMLAWVEDLENRDGGEEHLLNVLCAAVDTLDLILSMEGMSDQQIEARIMEGARFTDAANASGAGLGFTNDDVETQIAELGAMIIMDESMASEIVGARQECLAL